MYIYHYCLCLLVCLVVIINSRYIDPMYETERYDDFYFPSNHITRGDRSIALERYIRNLLAFNNHDDDESMRFERRGKAITKGDPREFMG